MMQETQVAPETRGNTIKLWLHGGTLDPNEGTFVAHGIDAEHSDRCVPESISHMDVELRTIARMTCAGIDAMQTLLGHAVKSLYGVLENKDWRQISSTCEYIDVLLEQIGDIASSSNIGKINLLKSNKSYLRLPYLSLGVNTGIEVQSWLAVGISTASVKEALSDHEKERFIGLFTLSHESGSSVNWIPSLGVSLAQQDLSQEDLLQFVWKEVGEVLPKLERLYQQLETQRNQIVGLVDRIEAELLILDEKVKLVQKTSEVES